MSLCKFITGTMAHPRLILARPVFEILSGFLPARLSALLSLLMLLCLNTAPLCAAGFLTAPTYPAGLQPVAAAVGDFNGDGIPDFAVANSGSDVGPGTLTILLGNGDGTFRAPLTQAIDVSPSAAPLPSLAAGDFNGDGRSDLVLIALKQEVWSVNIYLGNGDGTFQPAIYYRFPGAQGVAIGDFNSDGHLDLAVTNFTTSDAPGELNILLGNGDGTFQAPTSYPVGPNPVSVAVGDLNGDGNLDVAVANRSDGTVSILLGNGDGTFQGAQTYATGGVYSISVALGDFNGDGILDLAVGNVTTPGVSVSILLGNGDGTFQTPQTYGGSPGAESVAVGDFNGDGHLDIAVGAGSTVTIFLGKGDGTFQVSSVYAAGAGVATLVVVGDFNNDGIPDLAATNQDAGTVSIFLGRSNGSFQAAPCYPPGGRSVAVADFNADGILDLAVAYPGDQSRPVGDLFILLGNGDGTFEAPKAYAAGENPFFVAVGDFNGDGIPDLVVTTFQIGAGAISVLLGNGDGTFQAALKMGAGNVPQSVAVGDFNGDGKLDIVTTNFVENTVRGHVVIQNSDVRVFLGNGDGTFQPPQTYAVGPPDSAPTSVAVGDFNGDGALDLVVTNVQAGTLSILLGNGDGTFQAAQNRSDVGSHLRSVVVGDFNGDGIPDLAVAGSYSPLATETLKVLLGTGDGTFQAPQSYAVGSGAYSVAIGDFNRDDHLDLAVADVSGVSILLGNGDGTFQAAQSYAAGPGGQLGVGDFNRDGFPDLVVSNAVTVLLNTP